MDNEQKIFLQAFKELETLFEALPIHEAQRQPLKSILSGILKNAKNLALYDPITHALNSRAEKWLIQAEAGDVIPLRWRLWATLAGAFKKRAPGPK